MCFYLIPDTDSTCETFFRVTRTNIYTGNPKKYEGEDTMKDLSKAEEMIMLAVWRLKDNAYGVTIRKQIMQTANKDYTYGTLYGLLDQLVRKEFVERLKGEPTRERGGRSKTFYQLTPNGIEGLKHAIEIHRSVWDGINDLSFSRM